MIESLKAFLNNHPAGPIEDVSQLESLLIDSWDRFEDSSATAMKADKLRRGIEQPTWAPPLLLFEIERHGQTVAGSTRASVQKWCLNLNEMTARIIGERARQLYRMDKRLDVKPLAKELARFIIEERPDARLKWQADGSVRLKIELIIPETNKQTTDSRRARLRDVIDDLLKPHGWKSDRANVYRKG